MNDLVNRNAKATKQALESTEIRMQRLETEVTTLKNNVQTLINLVGELQRTNNLALAQLRGGGPTG